MEDKTKTDSGWINVCSGETGCCPEYQFTSDGGVDLREHGVVIHLLPDQLEMIRQQMVLRALDRDSRVR